MGFVLEVEVGVFCCGEKVEKVEKMSRGLDRVSREKKREKING